MTLTRALLIVGLACCTSAVIAFLVGMPIWIALMNAVFAVLCLTTWAARRGRL